jgi:hypothetical protein
MGTVTFDAVLTLADIGSELHFDVDVEQLEWDRIGMSIPAQIGNNVPDNGIIDVDGVTFVLNLSGDPHQGLTVDLIDNTNVTEIRGTPTFVFSHGDDADWDRSLFNQTGQLRFGGGPPPGIPGDYNGNGTVEQADLDLVLLNWGQPGVPAGWTNDLPDGNIDQAELDGVLLNWGNVAALGSGGGAGVPEPGTVVLLLLAAGFALARRIRHKFIAFLAAMACLIGLTIESSLAQMEFGGPGVTQKVFITGINENFVMGPAPNNGLGYLSVERYTFPQDGSGGPYNNVYNNFTNQLAYEAANTPDATGTIAAPIFWTSGNYPPGFGMANVNQEYYAVVIRGELFVPGGSTSLDFKDGNDDVASLILDTDGDGSLTDELAIIDDSNWTASDGEDAGNTASPGSPSVFVSVTNVAAGGSWRAFEFRMAEGNGGDNGALAWSGTDTDFDFPLIDTLPFGTAAGDDLIPATHLRSADAQLVQSYEYVIDMSEGGNFDVNVAELQWDRVAANPPPAVLGNNPTVTSTIDFSGGVVALRLTSDPVPGLTVDLVDDSLFIDTIIGPADFTFSHGDDALWDTSSFTTNGQISYAASAAQVLVGDYNGSGQVDQGDMDLVLLNWGQSGSDLPQGWVITPPTGNIDQDELDAVLLNWGALGGLGGPSAVPEPSTVALLAMAAAAGLALARRR